MSDFPKLFNSTSFAIFVYSISIVISILLGIYSAKTKSLIKSFLLFLLSFLMYPGVIGVGASHGGGCLPLPAVFLIFFQAAWYDSPYEWIDPNLITIFHLIIINIFSFFIGYLTKRRKSGA